MHRRSDTLARNPVATFDPALPACLPSQIERNAFFAACMVISSTRSPPCKGRRCPLIRLRSTYCVVLRLP